MKVQLAKRLIAETMQWDVAEAAQEFEWLELMVESKFDHYQGYGPGDRFYLHIIYWLEQFAELEERRTAYKFLRTRLVFISQREMHHLVALSYSIIKERMREAVAGQLGIKVHQTWVSDAARRRVDLLQFRTLYVALSDGARIDVFRRENEGIISNEQVVASSEITLAKWNDLVKELKKRLTNEGFGSEQATFERICLVDDFSGSGSSIIRQEDSGEWKGKVARFCAPILGYIGTHISSDAVIHLHHYLASSSAELSITERLEAYRKTQSDFRFDLTFSNVLSSELVVDDNCDLELTSLIKRYYDESCENTHVGKKIWYGYKKCGLPVVLDHNTPNNSLALLWAAGTDPRLMRPLFPRKQRHIDHGQSV